MDEMVAKEVAKKVKVSKKNSKADSKPPAVQLEHVMVPNVAQATEDEIKNLSEKSDISRAKLPLIKHDDPSIRFLSLRPGDVVKFTRTSLASGEPVFYYRLVVE